MENVHLTAIKCRNREQLIDYIIELLKAENSEQNQAFIEATYLFMDELEPEHGITYALDRKNEITDIWNEQVTIWLETRIDDDSELTEELEEFERANREFEPIRKMLEHWRIADEVLSMIPPTLPVSGSISELLELERIIPNPDGTYTPAISFSDVVDYYVDHDMPLNQNICDRYFRNENGEKIKPKTLESTLGRSRNKLKDRQK